MIRCLARQGPVVARNVVRYSSNGAPKGTAADWLVSLNQNSTDKNSEAEKWLATMQELREQWKPEGEAFNPSRAFAPEDASENYSVYADLVEEAAQERRTRGIKGSPEQIAEAEALKGKPIPPIRDETMDYLANVIMRHGKKSRAQRYLNQALYLVYLKTRKDPVMQLKEALEKMAPLARLKRYSDGGARAELVPVPLTERQRLRQAWSWILDASDKRQSRDFSVRLSEEIMSAIEGRGPGFEKKSVQHRTAISNRAYISLLKR